MNKVIKKLAAIAVAVGLIITTAGVAQAVGTRALATNNHLFGFDGVSSSNYGTVHELDPLTGSSTAIGSRGTYSPYGFPMQAAFNPAENSVYWINSDFNNAIPNYLMKADTTTGASVLVGEFLDDGSPTQVDSLAISPTGSAYAFSSGKFYSVNLTTAALSLINAATGKTRFYSFAYNPADQNFYAISNDTTGGLFAVNVQTGVIDQVLSITGFPNLGSGTSAGAKRVFSMAFDKAGSLWGVNVDGDLFSTVVTGPDAADMVTGIQLVGTPGQSATNSLAITYPSSSSNAGGSLANTGSSTNSTLGLSIAALGSLLAGAGMIFIGRRRTN